MGNRHIVKLTNQGAAHFFEDLANGSNRIAVSAPASLAADLNWTLPNNDAVGFLRNDGGGNLSWSTAPATLDAAYRGGSTITADIGRVQVQNSTGGELIRVEGTASGTASYGLVSGTLVAQFAAGFNTAALLGTTSAHGLNLQTSGVNRIQVLLSGEVGINSNPVAGTIMTIDRPAGGEVLRARAGGSGDPYISVLPASGGRELRLGFIDGGNAHVGTFSAHSLELRVNGSAAATIISTGEIGIGSVPTTNSKLIVTQAGNNAGLTVSKTGAGAGTALSVPNSGTGRALDIVQSLAPTDRTASIVASSGGTVLYLQSTGTCLDISKSGDTSFGARITNSGGSIGLLVDHTYTAAPATAVQISHDAPGPGGAALALDTITPGVAVLVLTPGSSATGGIVETQNAANGGQISLKIATSNVNPSGATFNAIAIPSGAIITCVTVRVTTAITGCTTFNVGDAGSASRYASAIAVALGTTGGPTSGTGPMPINYSSSANVVLTAVGGGGTFTGGAVRVQMYYLEATPPTS